MEGRLTEMGPGKVPRGSDIWKSTSTPGGEGEASSQERNQLVARPEGCPRPSRANRLGG